MTGQELLLAVVLAATNLASIAAIGWDKRRARRGGRRIPERELILLALLGGFAGGFIAMSLFRHKTRKASFLLPYVLVSAASFSALVLLYRELVAP